jgi:AraC-like DNA-binding protein
LSGLRRLSEALDARTLTKSLTVASSSRAPIVYGCGSSERRPANKGQDATSYSHDWSRCCSSKRLRPRRVTMRPPGLLRGLADTRLAPAIRRMHRQLERSWTVDLLARTAALSRSAFFDRFTRTVGLPPMEYLLAWRMAVAKDLLRRENVGLADVAERVGYGYGSASTFSTAFSRHVNCRPLAI